MTRDASVKKNSSPEKAAAEKTTGHESAGAPLSRVEFSRRVLIAGTIILLLTAVAVVMWYIVRVLELIFFAVLGAVFLRAISDWVSKWSRMPPRLAVTVVLIVCAGLIAFGAWLLFPQVKTQIAQMGKQLPRAVDQVSDFAGKYIGGVWAQKHPGEKILSNLGKLVQPIREFFSVTLEAVIDFMVVFFLTLYLVYTPEYYVKGIVKLVPVGRRQTASNILHALGFTLRWWLIGRFSTMAIVGILSGAGLWLLNIPLALTLGILAGLLTFIPYVGFIVQAVAAVLMALLVDYSHAVYVLLLYTGIHALEGYVLSPLIQERTVYMPPMVLLSSITGMTILLGIPGLILATPLTAVVLVLIRKIYVEEILEDREPSF